MIPAFCRGSSTGAGCGWDGDRSGVWNCRRRGNFPSNEPIRVPPRRLSGLFSIPLGSMRAVRNLIRVQMEGRSVESTESALGAYRRRAAAKDGGEMINANVSQTVFWHRELPPLDAEPVGEHTVEATSEHVHGSISHGDVRW